MSSMSYPPCTSFSTLYTKLAHDKLKSNFHPFLILLLKEGTKLFIRLSSGTSYWGKKTKGGLGFSKTSFKASLKTAINNLIKNCCYNIRNVTKKQAIGIPMGIDPVLFWANLFLNFYEEESVSFPRHPRLSRHFHSTRHFIDYLCALMVETLAGLLLIYIQRSLNLRLKIRVIMLHFLIWI